MADTQLLKANWQGIPLSVSYCPEIFTSYREVYGTALCRVIVCSEDGEILPPHAIGWVRADVLEDWGGPLPYVLSLLDIAADDPAWTAARDAARQLDLF